MDQKRKATLSQTPIERVSNWLSGAGSWIEGHLTLMGWGLACLLAIVVTGLSISFYRSSENARGLEAIRIGLVAMTNEQTENAIAHFAVATDHLDGRARQLAFFKLGEVYEKSDEPDKALQAYEALLGIQTEESNHYLVLLALLKLGSTAEKDGDTEAARSRYAEAAEIEGPGQSAAFLATAKILEQADDIDGAQSYYQRFLDSDTGARSPLKEVVEQKVK